MIIRVDTGELGDKGFLEGFEDMVGIQGADHALIVSGIGTSDPDNVKVILTYPGTGDVVKDYPMDQFLDALNDSTSFMVTTAELLLLNYNHEMINIDYSAGHISSIGEMLYAYFEQHIQPLAYKLALDNPINDILNQNFSVMVSGSLIGFSNAFLTELHYLQISHSVITWLYLNDFIKINTRSHDNLQNIQDDRYTTQTDDQHTIDVFL